MSGTKFISWNVNGIRAVAGKGFFEYLAKESPDIMAVQETKAWTEQLTKEILNPPGYYSFWSKPYKKGYSGVAVFSKIKPLKASLGFGIEKFDCEGRVNVLEFEKFWFLNIYFPNGGMGPERVKYKLEFYRAFLNFSKKLFKTGKAVIVCGDFNTAHKEIDLARPKENADVSGFLPEERLWIDKLLSEGFTDTFRRFNKSPAQYTWWDYKTRARERNVGWRIDYFLADATAMTHITDARIMVDVYGSDHCPIMIAAKNLL